MSRTLKIQKAHRVFSRVKAGERLYASASVQDRIDYQTVSYRHGNNRRVIAGRKRKAMKSRRMKEKEEFRETVAKDACEPVLS